jgi:NAD(P)-dependent dehydrogenase (short-subunit alcohol dehydrogenase family)
MSVEGKVVLVTGGARGMGREYVRAFLQEGAKVIATDMSWSPSGASGDDFDFLTEIKDQPNVITDVMDITIPSHVTRVYKAAMERWGTIDVIINNAGTRQRDLYPPDGYITVLESEVGDWQKMFDTHVFGNLRVIKTFTQPMLEKKSGSIINVCSGMIQNQNGTSHEGAYQPAKAALYVMTMYLAHELKPYNIAANVILPGHTRTTGSDEQEVGRAAKRAAENPERAGFGPMRMRPDNPVPLALFLAEQDASGTTGEMIPAMQWNEQHELGGREVWTYEPDLEAARASGRLEGAGRRPQA